MDPRQVVAALLTLSMFAMLGNMIKRDHFDIIEVRIPSRSVVQLGVIKIEDQEIVLLPKAIKGPWKGSSQEAKPCWRKPVSKELEHTKGFVTFSLRSGLEYHTSQIANAVVIARYLGATLVLPDIRGRELGQKKNFQDMYDVKTFIKSLDGVISIVNELPTELATAKPAVVRVPDRLSEESIVKNITPIFRTKSYLRLAISLHSTNMVIEGKPSTDFDSTACLAMFGSLEPKLDIREVGDLMIERLRTLSRRSDGRFVAVDLRVDTLEEKSCWKSERQGRKSCYYAHEIRDFLRKAGFDGDTTIYLTQTWWRESLNSLKNVFPKTYTKDDIIPKDMKSEILGSELERALDFHICSHSDVFVPAIFGMFYQNIAAKRIASGRSQMLVPGSAASDSDYTSQNMAHSCYC